MKDFSHVNKIDSSVLNTLRKHNICTSRKTKRGSRGGKRRIPVIISPRHDYIPCAGVINKKNLTHIDTSLFLQEDSTLFKVSYLNTQSARLKGSLINEYIVESNSDIMLLTETWYREKGDEVLINDIKPEGFAPPMSIPRVGRSGGGLCLVYKKSISATKKVLDTFTSFEACDFTLKSSCRTTKYICIYRPPPSAKNKLKPSTFINEFCDLLDMYLFDQHHLVFIGDFNLHFDSDIETYALQMKTCLHNRNLKQIVRKPTQKSNHILDWVIVRDDDELIQNIDVIDKCLSDHYVITFNVIMSKPKAIKRHIRSRDLKNMNHNDFSSDVKSTLPLSDSDDVETLTSQLNTRLSDTLDKHAPLKARTLSCRRPAPWRNIAVVEAKQDRRRAERKWRSTELTVHRQIFQAKNYEVKDVIAQAKTSYYTSSINECTTSKSLYTITNDLCGKNSDPILPNDIPKEELPDTFCSFFNDKVQNIRDDLDTSDLEPEFKSYNGAIFDCFSPVNETFVRNIVSSSGTKTCDLDPIPTSILKQNIDILITPITAIINASLKSGKVPSDFKSAILNPLIKQLNLDQNTLKNYRPVSGLAFLSKILEKVVYSQIRVHLNDNKLNVLLQSAYKEHHSTETAMLKILNDVLNATDRGEVTLLCLLDLSAAFDTIDHEILLTRLSISYGIRGVALEWFRSYLTDRKFYIKLNDVTSKEYTLKFGVPQGSVLGPVLYIMYTHSLEDVIKRFHLFYHMYSDDNQIYNSSVLDKFHDLVDNSEKCIDSVNTWMVANKLKNNTDKTEAIVCSTIHKLKSLEVNHISVGEVSVDFSKDVKGLGVHIDRELSMEKHVNQLCKSAYFEISKIAKIRPYIDTKASQTLASSFILSRLDYCNSLLSGITQERIKKLQRVQNSAARLIVKARKKSHITPILKELHWLPIYLRIDFKTALFCYKALNGLAPEYIKDLIVEHKPERQMRSCGKKLLVEQKMRLVTYGDRAFSACGPRIWNSLPIEIRMSPTVTVFKSRLKTFYFRQHFK